MTGKSLFVKDAAAARWAVGGQEDAETTLGCPLPDLPTPEVVDGRPSVHVNFNPRLRTLLQRFLHGLLSQLRVEVRGVQVPPEPAKDQAAFEAALGRALRSVYAADRRLGLANLFWLAHSGEVADCLRELEQKAPALRRAKHALHPLLSSLYRRLDESARRGLEKASPGRLDFLAGARATSVLDAVLDDGLALFEPSLAELDLSQVLYANKRYRLTPELFLDFLGVLQAEAERRLREGDRGLLARLARHAPCLGREQLSTQAGLQRAVLQPDVQAYLLADAWGTGARLTQSPRLRAEAEKRRPAELAADVLELGAALRRFEYLDQARSRLVVVRDPGEMDEAVRRGRRVYDFSEAAQVLNNAVDATVLFLDLRGFTRTSEGQVSARDLTEELYTVFDTFVPHIVRFGGTVDKFLGDGIMATFGTKQVDPLGPLNALRSAVLCQEELIRLRRQGRTAFKMGISVHYGRVYVARFVAGPQEVQVTVIGRNVNLAGRLSSAAKKPMDEDVDDGSASAPSAVRELQVVVDGTGTLFNEGIALSRAGLVQLEENLSLVHHAGGNGVFEYQDEAIGRRLFIRYAGDAKFKGVRSSFPVYEVDFVR